MYTPPAYAEHDIEALHDGMRAWSFATLITVGVAGARATHLPFLLDPEADACGRLTTHLARANPQLDDLRQGAPALVIFQGPHAFVSPSWYRNRMTFPTWNYTAIHARGLPRLIEDPAAIHDVLRRTIAVFDTPVGGEWDFETIPQAFTATRLSAIVAVEIPIESLEGKMKLNQDKSVEDRLGVIAALERAGEPQGLAVADMIRRQPDMPTAASRAGPV